MKYCIVIIIVLIVILYVLYFVNKKCTEQRIKSICEDYETKIHNLTDNMNQCISGTEDKLRELRTANSIHFDTIEKNMDQQLCDVDRIYTTRFEQINRIIDEISHEITMLTEQNSKQEECFRELEAEISYVKSLTGKK